jgi:uncharacterized protein with HEPN domain
MRDYRLFIKDIYDAVIAIEKFVWRMSFNRFINDDKTLSAVIKKLEIIGEAAKNLPPEITSKYNSIKWKEMAGFRDILVHAYFGTELHLIWDTIKNDLPKLKRSLEDILKENK